MPGGHSTLNTVVLGEGVSKYQIHPLLWPPSNHAASIAASYRIYEVDRGPKRVALSCFEKFRAIRCRAKYIILSKVYYEYSSTY
jgi:hypothetical protein